MRSFCNNKTSVQSSAQHLLENPETLTSLLIAWYRKRERELPWRHTYDPYHIWISEIMLQQTQMERGVAYFNRWIERFPDVYAVAAAKEQEILRFWQGLGYYARARNIHRAAKQIVEEFEGRIPDEYQTLLSLPGIGPYTAAAIASIAGNHDVAVIDTNVARVYARLFDIAVSVKKGEGLRQVQFLAKKILPKGRARHYNQAIMDFGGLLCTPRNPKCGKCPVQQRCRAFSRGTVEMRPVPPAGKQRVREVRLVGLICCKGRFLLRQRKEKELWAGLWDLPGTLLYSIKEKNFQEPPLPKIAQISTLLSHAAGREVVVEKFLVSVKHQYTHHLRTVHCWLCFTSETKVEENQRWVCKEELSGYGVPSGVSKIFDWLDDHPFPYFSSNKSR